jgi:hypothetical protein
VIGDADLALATIINCFQYMKPLLHPDPTIFSMHVLLTCHNGFIKNSGALKKDQADSTLKFFLPITQILIKHLLILKDHANVVKIACSSLEFIGKVSPATNLVLFSSNNLETKWQMVTDDMKKKKGGPVTKGKTVKTGTHEFSYHIALAMSREPRVGLAESRSWEDRFSEYLDSVIICYSHDTTASHSHLVDKACGLYAKKPITFQKEVVKTDASLKRTLDAVTSIKEFYTVLSNAGVESVYQQLAPFRKNPRFIELCTRCIGWSVCTVAYIRCVFSNQAEVSVRIFTDVVDWIDLRNASVLYDEFFGDFAAIKKNLPARRKRRGLFITRTLAYSEDKKK